jgi:hypothetical protein
MVRVLFWTAFFVGLGLAHIHLRMATRDMSIQASRFQVQAKDLWIRQSTLTAEVARLRGGDRMLDYAQQRLGLIALPADQIEVWKMPSSIMEKFDRVCSEIALERTGKTERTEPEPLVARVLGAVLSPVQAQQPVSQER